MTTGIEQSIGIPFSHIEGVSVSLPRVSVIIGNYNQGRFIRDAIFSAARQTYTSFECVIVDDKSDDASVQHIRSALEELRDPRFRLIERGENGGQMAAMLTGLDAVAAAPFVAFLDADDIWLPDFLETHIAYHLSARACAAISSSGMAIIDEEGALLSGIQKFGRPLTLARLRENARIPFGRRGRTRGHEVIVPKLGKEFPPSPGAPGESVLFVENRYFGWHWTATSAMLFRRAVLDLIRPSDPGSYRACADYYWATFAHIVGGSLVGSSVHGYYRMHGGNMFAKHAILGHGTIIGGLPKSIREAAHRAIVEKLTTGDLSRGPQKRRIPSELKPKWFWLQSIAPGFARLLRKSNRPGKATKQEAAAVA